MNFNFDSPSVSFPFQELLSDSSIIFYQCEVEEDYPLRFISRNVQDILGIVPEEFKQNNQLWMDRIQPEDRQRVMDAFDGVVEDDSDIIEYRLKHDKGHYIWRHDEMTLVRDETGQPESIVGASIELTGRMQDGQKPTNQHEHRIAQPVQDSTDGDNRLKLLEMAITNINDMVVITKAPRSNPLESEIVFVNKSFEEFTGYSNDEVKGQKPVFLHGPETSDEAIARINRHIEKLKPLREEFINYKKDGTTYWVELDMAPFPGGENDELYWVGINRNITRRKEAEQRIQDSLKEKKVLLSEIHHRVKNNLAVISGLLEMQAFNEQDQGVIQKLQESQARIQSIAMVHEKLYQSESLSSIQMDTYVDQLTDYISGVFVDKQHADIEIRNNAQPITLKVSQAVPCGMILNELITNAFKHAFDGPHGVLEINLYKQDPTVVMQVKDNGNGLPKDFSFSTATSLGSTLVQTLVAQIGAELMADSSPGGTTISIYFEVDK